MASREIRASWFLYLQSKWMLKDTCTSKVNNLTTQAMILSNCSWAFKRYSALSHYWWIIWVFLVNVVLSKLFKSDVNKSFKQCAYRRNKEIKSIAEGLGEKYHFSCEHDPVKVLKVRWCEKLCILWCSNFINKPATCAKCNEGAGQLR